MKQNPEIAQELKQLGVNLPQVDLPYSAPEGYFERFEAELQERLTIETILEKLPKETPYQIDPGYFDSFEDQLHSAIYMESLPKEMPYDLPVGYFDEFEKTLHKHIGVNKPEMKPHRKVSPVFSYMSIAASIVLILGISFWMMRMGNKPSVEQQLATISNAEIQSYIASHQAEFGNEIALENVDESLIDVSALEQEVYGNFDFNTISSEELDKFVF